MSKILEMTVIEGGESLDVGQEITVRSEESLRHLPGRRRVYRAVLGDGMPVLCKHYTHPKKAGSDAAGEWDWLRLLNRAELPVPRAMGLAENAAGERFVLTEWLAQSQELGEVMEGCSSEEMTAHLQRLIALVHGVHEAGFLQEDLHLGNFLLGDDGKLWLIDAASHRRFDGGVPQGERIRNWALLRANLRVDQRPAFDRAFEAGAAAGCFPMVVAATPGVLRSRLRRYRAKCQRSCTEFVRTEVEGTVLLRERKFDPDWLAELVAMDPERLAAEHRILKRASKCLVVHGEAGDGRAWVLKTHAYRGWSQTGRMSRARRSWIAGHALRLLGVATPESFAFWERREGGRLVRDGLLMAVDDGTPLQRWVREEHAPEQRRRVVHEVSALFEILAELHASHGDTKASNFHVGEEGALRVIDLDSFQWGGLRWRRRLEKDRARFARNAVKFPAGAALFSLTNEDD